MSIVNNSGGGRSRKFSAPTSIDFSDGRRRSSAAAAPSRRGSKYLNESMGRKSVSVVHDDDDCDVRGVSNRGGGGDATALLEIDGNNYPQQQEERGQDTPGAALTHTQNHQNSPSSSTKVEVLYHRHPYLLYFTTAEVEKRYFNYQYVDNSFIPGKLFAFVWGFLLLGSFVIFTAPFNDKGAYMIEAFSSKWWMGVYASSAITIFSSIGLFLAALKPYREIIHLAQILTGWPALYLVTLVLKKPYAFNYSFLFGCTGFSMFIVQARVCRLLPFITVWPLICLFTITFAVPGYWDTHTMVEMLYWIVLLLPTGLLVYLEKQVRQSFVDKEVALQEIAESEHKTAVTQKMIANFFPATPTRDLLQQLNGPRDKAYPDTVLIVTDIAGFTAYTSRSDPTDVIAMLTDMFQSFDITADQYGVEKIATVGDSYCGAVFPSRRRHHINHSSGDSTTTTETTTTTTLSAATIRRCNNAIQYSCAALPFAGYGLQLRVGVHIGDIVGVFVGCVPPKFDLFGVGIDHARIMEEEGRPGYVHISTATLERLNGVGAAAAASSPSPSTSSKYEGLEHTTMGVLCTAWGDTFDFSFREDDDEKNEKEEEILDSASIVTVLCSFANIDTTTMTKLPTAAPITSPTSADTSTPIIPIRRDTTISEGLSLGGENEDGVTSSRALLGDGGGGEEVIVYENGEDEFSFHPIFLVFKTDSIERHFTHYIHNVGVNHFCSRVFLGIGFVLLIIQLNLQCGSSRDMGISAAVLGLLSLLTAYIIFIGSNHKYHFPITIVTYDIMMVVMFLVPTTTCEGLYHRVKYVGDFGGLYACIAIFAGQYCLDTKLVRRFCATVATSVIGGACLAIRQNTIGDDATPMDPLPICGLAFVIMSFFPEYSLRSAFQSELRLRKLRKAARSRGAAMATSALSIMLPTFVTERIIALSREANNNSNNSYSNNDTNGDSVGINSDTQTLLSAPSTNNDETDLDINGVAATWEYGFAVLMFIKFSSTDPAFTPTTINATVQAIEQIMTRFEVMKVKTIGSTVMLVSGIDDPRTRQEQLSGVIDAAMMVRAVVMPEMKIPNLWCRIGIHCGPCFGAVIGGNGAIFDLFGDTVNTASRMTSTAPEDAIQLSSSANALILPRLREYVHAAGEPVVMKGKGAMEVYHVDNTIPIDHLPDLGL